LNNWLRILNQPFPINTWRRYWLRGAGFGLFVFLFLFLFKPFSLNLYPTGRLLYTTAVYGFTTGIVIFAGSFLLIKIIAPHINEEKWTLGKQILWNTFLMICITLMNVLVTQLMHGMSLPLWWYFTMLKWVFMLGVLPIAISELLTYNHFLRSNMKSAAQMSQLVERTKGVERKVYDPVPTAPLSLQEQIEAALLDHVTKKESKTIFTGSTLLLTGENQGDKLELYDHSLLAVQAIDNYVNIFWEEKGRLQTTMLRNTLTNIAEQLNGLPNIYRSHRGWLVNTRRVTRVDGNAQGLKLSVDLLQQQVPVSRGNIAGYRQLAEWEDMVLNN
jgi:hypothetical protein